MKISVNWVKEYTGIDISIEELQRKIGAQLGEIEETVHLGKKYEGVVVAKVVQRDDHPNADRLSICRIDDNKKIKGVKRDKDGYVQVVCGAPNVRKGMMVAWLPPGSIVPSTFGKEPFVLESREVRGEISNGMLASAHELGISDDHTGILEVDVNAKPGSSFAKVYDLDDIVIDIENKMFTHRPDCFGLLGVAREIAGIQHEKFTSPKWYMDAPKLSKGAGLQIDVKNELPEITPRFMAVAIKDVQIAPSPVEIQVKLQKVGIKPINNIVDITNYMMYLTGQPLHAYDYDKVKARSSGKPTLVIRHAKKGEKLKVLGGKVIQPNPNDIMIATDKELIGFGGVIGGADTEVDDNTTSIILECANFDLYAVRKTAMAHGLFTDAVTRFSKGQSPLQTDRVLAKTLESILEGGAKQASALIDDKHLKGKTFPSLTMVRDPLNVESKFINKRLGLELSEQEIMMILKNVEFFCAKVAGAIEIQAPFWRTDIAISEDIVEEVGRLYGYDRIPLKLPSKKMNPSTIDHELRLKTAIRSKLASAGANEILSYSFVHGSLLDKVQQDDKLAYKIRNALSPDLQYYRLSITPSLLEKVHPNLKAGHEQFALFEIGKTHGKSETDDDGLPNELGRLGVVIASNKKSTPRADYFQAKYYLEQLYPKSAEITYHKIEDTVLDKHKMASQMLAPYEPKRSAVVFVNGKPAGVVGEYKAIVAQALKLPKDTAGLEVFLSSLSIQGDKYKPISKYPRTEQDISLRTSSDIPFASIKSALEEALEQYSPQDVDTDVSCIDIFQKDQANKQTAFRVRSTSHERTLTTKIISLMLDKSAEALESTIKAKRV